MRRLRIAAPAQLSLVMPGTAPSPSDRWSSLPQAAQTSVLGVLARMIARGVVPDLAPLIAPTVKFPSLLNVFETVLKQEQDVTAQIDALYELAFKEKQYATTVELQWFLTEQVEEEQSAREILAKLRMVKDDPASILDLDRDLGSRSPGGH